MNRTLTKLLSMMMVFVIFFSAMEVSALAASSPDMNQTFIGQKQQERANEQTKRIAKFPNRVADVTVRDKAGKRFTTHFYLTPETVLNLDSFKSLSNSYQVEKFDVRPLTSDEALALEPEWVDTIFDVGNFILSLAEFNANPTFWNGFWVVMDGASVVFPGVPSISGVKSMIESSPKLYSALKIGVMQYGTLKNKTIPYEWERHHIIEKRFAPYLGWDYLTTENNMLAIPMPKEDHLVVTNILRQKIPYDTPYWSLFDSDIMNAHKEAYYQMYYETYDEYWKFLAKFVETGQYRY